MSPIRIENTVGELVAGKPALSRVFESLGIDFCCGGKKTLEEACRKKGLDAATVARLLDAALDSAGAIPVDATAMGLTELTRHIETTHHAYLRGELPRLLAMSHKVAAVHGEQEPRLVGVRDVVTALAAEMHAHMHKEEQILFPMIRAIEAGEPLPDAPCRSLANPIAQMEREHDAAGDALGKLHELTDAYTPPSWACNTFRALFDALAELERDMHQHVHKENNVLFPRALEREAVAAA